MSKAFIDRLNTLINENNLSFYRLSQETGINQATFTRLKSGEHKPSFEVLNKVASFFKVSKEWLETGEGEMIKPKEPSDIKDGEAGALTEGRVIPLYDADAAAGNAYGVNMSPARPVEMIQIGGFLRESEAALRVYGNSMTPNYPAGCVVGLRPHNDSFIEPGCVYVIETTDNRFLKRLYYNKNKTAFRCVSDNHMVHETGPMTGEYYYPEFDIPFDSVRRLFRVVGVIKRNIL